LDFKFSFINELQKDFVVMGIKRFLCSSVINAANKKQKRESKCKNRDIIIVKYIHSSKKY